MDKKWSKEKIKKEIIEWVFCFVIAYILYLLLNYYLIAISGVKQISMKPTANEGEKILIQRTILTKKDIKNGDIITFSAPSENINIVSIEEDSILQGNDAVANYNEYKGLHSFLYNFVGIGRKSYIKRVIGVEGDHIVITEDGLVYRNDELINETYLKDNTTSKNGAYVNVIVPKDTIYVMGDNRLQSMDSRSFGCVPIDKVDGYVLSRVWPITKIGGLK